MSLLSLIALALPAAAQAPAEAPLILRADLVVTADGTTIENGAVLVRGGRILAVGESVPEPANATVVRLEGVLAPGFVDAFTSWGAADAIGENSRALTPGLVAADSLDPGAPDWPARLARGITAVHLVPPAAKPLGVPVAAGWGSAVLAAGEERVVRRQTRPVLSLASYSQTSQVRGPTSLAGAAAELDRILAGGSEWPGGAGIFYVDSAEAVSIGRDAAGQGGFAAVWIALGDPATYGGLLAGQSVGLPAGGAQDLGLRRLETWKRLHDSGARIAFGTAGEPADLDALRMAAMAYARATGDPAAALAAVTSAAADLAGLERAGRIAPGARADLVLWSGHPLDSTSRVMAVMLGGRTVYSAAPREGSR